jgi:hypothetical protein
MTVMVVQEIEGTKDFNFIYNNVCIAVALLQTEEYYLYFNSVGYNGKVMNLCLNSLKVLNDGLIDSLKQEKVNE